MTEKKHLDEQTYQSNKKKLNIIALSILITAVVVGLGLIIVPRVFMTAPATAVISDSELNAQIAAIESEYTKKMGEPGWFEEQVTKNNSVMAARKAKSDAASAAFKAEGEISFVTFGGIAIIFVGAAIAGNLFYFANFRKVAGYAAQGIMPVAKEAITDIAPTIGAAYGTVAKGAASGIGEIAKEIKKGLSEDKK